ncbi:Disease resistance protein RPS5 [Rhynchospora pubera]|uniref:Disease resistance protein RPS5 n=1 Tax=Rhynchospora pubera TaxID=906938 RepID=A0AAV8GUA3_9POAL|nr:Disease resistance protein RPS5 [Rhynchospora pubera]
MELFKPAVSSLVPLAVNTITKHVVYPFTAHGNLRALVSATDELRALKEDMNTVIVNAERENGAPTNQAQEWLIQVETIDKEAEEIHKKYQQVCRCVFNISPNLCGIYKISRRAAEKYVKVKNLCDKRANIEVIVQMPPPLVHEIPASSSISPNLASALCYIKDDVNSNIIGIWGMGGVGKTHLLKLINNDLSRDHAFDVVVFVTCSKECSEEKVQNEIIGKLGLAKNDSIEQKQNTIFNFLRERSFVLLLDDLWSRVDLNTIGIPDMVTTVGTSKRKVVLTTRSAEVCGQMEVKKKIKVDVLKWDDAWSLFKDKVTEETINSYPLIQKYAMDVAKELGGLPLALITVGRAMHDKIDPSEWEQAVVLLKKARLNDVEFSHVNQSIFHMLRFSYDSLKNDILRQCFLHCSLWPEDHHIEKNELVELWMGLGLIDEPEIQAAYNVGYSYIRRLQAVCLLESDDDDTIIIHDVIRDMIQWITNNQGVDMNKWIVQAGTYQGSKEIKISYETEKLSVMNNFASNITLCVTCPSTKLSTLLLKTNNLTDSKMLRLELFSELTILDFSYNMLEAFPVEICKLVHLRFLNLSFNRFKSLPEELAALINLKYLLLRGTICTFPKNIISKLKSLRVLDLSSCYRHMDDNYEIFPMLEEDLLFLSDFQALGITISSMHVLQKLSQTVSVPIRWLDVLKYNESILSFSSCFLGNSQLQSNLISLQLRHTHDVKSVKFESTTGNRNICYLKRLEYLYFEAIWNMKDVVWNNLDPKDVFPRLQVLEFHYCVLLRSISWIINLPCIRELTVMACSKLRQLICINDLRNSGISMSQHSFPFLKKMILYTNSGLESISDPIITFPALEFLKVVCCDKLKKLPFNTGNPPTNLKKILGTEEWWNYVEMDDSSHRYLLPFSTY